jgi:DNA-binding LacI/PurR family transcriptional regulator
MTLREFAAKLGLSKTTVADALRDRPWVKAATREHVQAKALEWGYAPNPVASAFLRQVRSKGASSAKANLAVLIPWEKTEHPMLRGAARRAAELGYAFDPIVWRDYSSAASLTRVLLARGVLGVLVCPLVLPVGHLTLDWSRFAAAAIGYSMVRPAIHRVVHHHIHGMRLAIRVCRRQGFRRIGLVLRRREGDARSNGNWSAAFWRMQQELPPPERVEPFLVSDEQYTPENIAAWMARERPEAVIFHTAVLIPELPEFSGTPSVTPVVLDRLPRDTVAGVDQRYEVLGALAVDSLSSQILHNRRGLPEHPTITMLEGVWVERA